MHGGQCLAHITEANVSALASDSVRSRESQAKRIDNTSQRDSQDSKPDMNEKPADSAATQLSRSAGAGIIGKPLFVWGGLPGEIVNVRITKKRNSYLGYHNSFPSISRCSCLKESKHVTPCVYIMCIVLGTRSSYI